MIDLRCVDVISLLPVLVYASMIAIVVISIVTYIIFRMFPVKRYISRLGYWIYASTWIGQVYFERKLKQAKEELQGQPHSNTQPIRFSEVLIHTVPYAKDNYCYIIVDEVEHVVVVVDPGDHQTVQEELKKNNLIPNVVLTTHKHWDHSSGNEALRQLYPSLSVYSGSLDSVPGITHTVSDGEIIACGRLSFRAILCPGHTIGHMVYVLEGQGFKAPNCIFSGDHIFVGGIGKLFECAASDMLSSLDKVLSLPHDSLIFPGHEYGLPNLEFALSLEPDNQIVRSKLDQFKELRKNKLSTSPTTLADELTYNPFLRVSDPALASRCSLPDSPSESPGGGQGGDPPTRPDRRVRVLAEFRRRKDLFKPSINY